MVRSRSTTVEEYLEELPEDRRVVIAAVRKVILKNLPKGYQETMNWGMISYEIPLERFPKTYNKQPLLYAALAAQKNYFAVYLMTVCSAGAGSVVPRGVPQGGQEARHGQVVRALPQAGRPAAGRDRTGHRPHAAGEVHRLL